MPIRLLAAGLVSALIVALGVFFATGQERAVFGPANDSCQAGQHTATRHRSGNQPRNLSQGLRRRTCGFVAQAARRANRAPQEYNYVLIGVDRQQLPAIVDSNSPAFWDGDTLRLFNSAWEEAYQSSGDAVEQLANPERIELPKLERPGAVWLEAVWRDPDTEVLYGWYHFEPADLDCQTAPVIGAAVSYDLGLTWEDRGTVIDSPYGLDCDYDNGYFAGGNGDFSVIMGPGKRYLYFLYTSYAGPTDQQGVAVARSLIQDKGQPGTIYKYYNNGWAEPGLSGRQTILFGTSTGWKGPYVESFWGPSVHWNTYLNSYVALLNHTQGEQWAQEGVYITFSKDLVRWTEPTKLLDANDWYPQVLGLGPNETDTLAGKDARLYVGGISDYVIQFTGTMTKAGRRAVQPKASVENSPPLADRVADKPRHHWDWS